MALKADGGEQTSSIEISVPPECVNLNRFRHVIKAAKPKLGHVEDEEMTFTLLKREDRGCAWNVSEELEPDEPVPTTNNKHTLLLVKYPPSSKSSSSPPAVSCCHRIGVEGRRFRAMMSLTLAPELRHLLCRRFRPPHRRHDGHRGYR